MPLLPRLTERERGSFISAAPNNSSGPTNSQPQSTSLSPHRNSQQGSIISLPMWTPKLRGSNVAGGSVAGQALSPALFLSPLVQQQQQQQPSPVASPCGFRSKSKPLPARVDIDIRDQRRRVQAYEAARGMQRRAQENREMAYWEGRRDFHALASHCLVEEARNYRQLQLQPPPRRPQPFGKVALTPSPPRLSLRNTPNVIPSGVASLPLSGTPITSQNRNSSPTRESFAEASALLVVKGGQGQESSNGCESGGRQDPSAADPRSPGSALATATAPTDSSHRLQSILPPHVNQFYDEIHRDVDILLSPADPVNRSVSVRRQLAELHLFASPQS